MADELFGEIEGGLQGREIHSLVPERMRETHRSHFARFWTGPSTKTMGQRGMELVGLRRDGVEFPVQIGLTPRAYGGRRYVVATVLPVRKENQ